MDEWLGSFPINDDTSVADQRQERINNAFQLSKASYRDELVVLSPSFFHVDPAGVAQTANNDRFGLQNTDASIQEAYIKKDYRTALSLCLAYLDGIENDEIILEGNGAGRDREYYDIALKACVRLKEVDVGMSLAERSRHLWKPYYTIGMSAAEFFNLLLHASYANAYTDSISTLLASVPLRSNTAPFLSLLVRAFANWVTQLDASSENHTLHRHQEHEEVAITLLRAQREAAAHLQQFLDGYRERASMPFYHGTSLSHSGSAQSTVTTPGPAPSIETIRVWCVDAGFEGEEFETIVLLCTSKATVAGGEDDVDGEGLGKSVRSM